MRERRFFTDLRLETGNRYTLDSRTRRHVLKVLRMGTGDELILFNGDGRDYYATLIEAESGTAIVSVSEARESLRESCLKISIGQGIARGERMDWILQKSVELGVNSITPLWTERSQIKLGGERLRKRHAHWLSVIHSACEQSGRARVPDLAGARGIDDWCAGNSAPIRIILDPEAGLRLEDIPENGEISLLIGPEGGFCAREVKLAKTCGFIPIRLGPRTLRTETAALAAISAIQARWGDFR